MSLHCEELCHKMQMQTLAGSTTGLSLTLEEENIFHIKKILSPQYIPSFERQCLAPIRALDMQI